MDLTSEIERLYKEAKTIGNGDMECPLCSNTYERLRTHLRSCIPKHENKPSQGKVVQKQSSTISTKKCKIPSVQAKTEPRVVSEKSKYYSARAKGVGSTVSKAVSHKDGDMQEVIRGTVSKIADKEAELAVRLHDARLQIPDVQLKIEEINYLLKSLLKYLNKNCPEGKWKMVTSGSYYEKLKITSLDEIDCMMVCQLAKDSSKIEYMKGEKLFIKIKVENSRSTMFNNFNIINKDGYISPKMFREIFSRMVKKFLIKVGMKARGIVMEKEDPLSPAITLKNRTESLFIDIVPGIEIDGWPEVCANCEEPANLGTSDINVFHLVTKIHNSEIDKPADECKMWRLSFSLAEKKILLPLDDYDGRGTKLTCRKDVLRLLKCDLAEVKKRDFEYISSYMLKTVILHLTRFHHEQKLWLSSEIRNRYVEALLVFKNCLEKRFVEHYFVEHANLMKKSKDETAGERREVEAVIKFINQKFHF